MLRSATHCTVSIAHIHVPAERRGTNRETIERLADSIATLGLLSPILIRDDGNQVGETRRYEAADQTSDHDENGTAGAAVNP
jgi:hypothetical protein